MVDAPRDGVLESSNSAVTRTARKQAAAPLSPPDISLLLVDAMRLSRDCIAQTLTASARDFIVAGLTSSGDIAAEGQPDVVLFNLHSTPLSDHWATDNIAEIRRRTGAPIVVISGVEDERSALYGVSMGLRGFVPASVDVGMLIAAIRLVLAGGTFIPQEIVTNYAQKISETAEADENSVTFLGFTPREAEVLEKIRQGKINKIIAYELNISESTVKIHVRHIMRKLNATTRTQAAYLVQNRAPAR